MYCIQMYLGSETIKDYHVIAQIVSKLNIITVGGPRGVMVKAMDCGIVVSEFVLQSRYYVHFRTNTLGKGMNTLILPVPLLFFEENGFGIK